MAASAETVELRLRLISRTGKFKSGEAVAVDVESGKSFPFKKFDSTGNAMVKVPAGRYDVNAIDVSVDPANPNKEAEVITLMSNVGVRVAAATTVTLDATKGKPVTAAVEGVPTELLFAEIGVVSSNRKGDVGGTVSTAVFPEDKMFAVSGGRVTDHTQAFFLRASLGRAPEVVTHQLAFLERGGIPAALGFKVKQQDLAVVHANYPAFGPSETVTQVGAFAEFDLPGTGELNMKPFNQKLPSKTTEYYTPGVEWTHGQLATTQTTEAGAFTWSTATYQKGRTYRTDWNQAPVGPAFNKFNAGVGIEDKKMYASFAVFSGGNPDQFTDRYGDDGGYTGTLTLSRDGKEIGRSKSPDWGEFKLPSGTGLYTLRSEATRNVPWTYLGTKVDTSWTFRDTRDVFVVRTTGTDGTLKLTPQSQTGTPKLAALTVDFSVDDGKTWRSAPVTGTQAKIQNPAPGGFVSLRVSARDAGGNTVSQTVLRAYQVSAR